MRGSATPITRTGCEERGQAAETKTRTSPGSPHAGGGGDAGAGAGAGADSTADAGASTDARLAADSRGGCEQARQENAAMRTIRRPEPNGIGPYTSAARALLLASSRSLSDSRMMTAVSSMARPVTSITGQPG